MTARDADFPPDLATDCHTHLVGDRADYPMTSPRSYTPAPATPADMRSMMDRVGLQRVVVVQISVFGNDNACMIDGMKVLGPCARGVVHAQADTSGAALDELHEAGVRGIRVNLNTVGVRDPAEVRQRLDIAASKCARNGWHVQIFTSPTVLASIGAHLRDLPVPVVVDHFGLLPVRERGGAGERVLRDLLASGQGWVKISGSYRLDHPDATDDIAALAQDLYAINPDNVVWGSDWPHPPRHNSAPEPDPAPRPYRDIDPRNMLAMIGNFFSNPSDRARILVANPARLYDFSQP